MLSSVFNTSLIRRQFPILKEKIDGHALVYLDSAATAQKPVSVLNAMDGFYRTQNGNAHRGMHPLAERATQVLEGARMTVRNFLNASSPEEIIFTRNATEGINLVARSLGSMWEPGSGVVLSVLEHHSNIVPWQQIKEERRLEIDWVEIDGKGAFSMESLKKILGSGSVKMVAVTGLSNVLGTRPPLEEIIEEAHAAGALVLVDASQLIAHEPVDVARLDCDFLVFSGHKVFGPLGIGVLYGKAELLRSMPPFLGGGTMIRNVTTTGFTSADLPQKFEAGTQPVAEAAGLAAAIDWLQALDRKAMHAHEESLLAQAIEGLSGIPGVTILGPSDAKKISGCVSFTTKGVHPHDLTEVLGRKGICLRAGHHCAMPLHEHLKIPASTRLSVSVYNTAKEIDAMINAIPDAISLLI